MGFNHPFGGAGFATIHSITWDEIWNDDHLKWTSKPYFRNRRKKTVHLRWQDGSSFNKTPLTLSAVDHAGFPSHGQRPSAQRLVEGIAEPKLPIRTLCIGIHELPHLAADGGWNLAAGLKMGVSGRTKQTSKQVSNMLDFSGDTSSDLDWLLGGESIGLGSLSQGSQLELTTLKMETQLRGLKSPNVCTMSYSHLRRSSPTCWFVESATYPPVN
jgi:hypothetical protein